MAPKTGAGLALPSEVIGRGRTHSLPLLDRRVDALFGMAILVALGTVPWRVSVFTWWPLAQAQLPPFPPVDIGILSLLPVVLFAGWVVMRWRRRSVRPWHWGAGAIVLPLLGLTLLGLTGLHDTSPESMLQLGGLGLMWLVYLFYVNERTPLAPVLAAIVLLQGMVAFGQLVEQRDLGLAGLGEPKLDLAVYSISVLQARGHAWMRGYGLTPSPNVLGACLAILIVVLLPSVLFASVTPAATTSGRLQRMFFTLAVTVGVLGLLASFSRAAWLGFALGASVCVWTALKGGRRIPPGSRDAPSAQGLSAWWLAPVLAGLGFAVLYGDLAASRLIHLDTPTEARSLDERGRDASLALDIIQVHPSLGVGTGNYAHAARAINPDAQVVHNVPLMVTAEWGLPGAALWLALAVIGLCKRSAVRPAWLALLVISLFDLSLWPTTSWHGAILFGLLTARMSGDSFPRARPVNARVGNHSGEG